MKCALIRLEVASFSVLTENHYLYMKYHHMDLLCPYRGHLTHQQV